MIKTEPSKARKKVKIKEPTSQDEKKKLRLPLNHISLQYKRRNSVSHEDTKKLVLKRGGSFKKKRSSVLTTPAIETPQQPSKFQKTLLKGAIQRNLKKSKSTKEKPSHSAKLSSSNLQNTHKNQLKDSTQSNYNHANHISGKDDIKNEQSDDLNIDNSHSEYCSSDSSGTSSSSSIAPVDFSSYQLPQITISPSTPQNDPRQFFFSPTKNKDSAIANQYENEYLFSPAKLPNQLNLKNNSSSYSAKQRQIETNTSNQFVKLCFSLLIL
jgi:hypothetical protein